MPVHLGRLLAGGARDHLGRLLASGRGLLHVPQRLLDGSRSPDPTWDVGVHVARSRGGSRPGQRRGPENVPSSAPASTEPPDERPGRRAGRPLGHPDPARRSGTSSARTKADAVEAARLLARDAEKADELYRRASQYGPAWVTWSRFDASTPYSTWATPAPSTGTRGRGRGCSPPRALTSGSRWRTSSTGWRAGTAPGGRASMHGGACTKASRRRPSRTGSSATSCPPATKLAAADPDKPDTWPDRDWANEDHGGRLLHVAMAGRGAVVPGAWVPRRRAGDCPGGPEPGPAGRVAGQGAGA